MDPLLQNSLSAVGGAILTYISTYFTEKRKQQALIDTIGRLTEEKRKVEVEFNLLEERSKQGYEKKIAQYEKFIEHIGQMRIDLQNLLSHDQKDAFKMHYTEYLKATDPSSKRGAIASFRLATNANTDKLRAIERRLLNEFEIIKLRCSEDVYAILEELRKKYKDIFNLFEKLLREDADASFEEKEKPIAESIKTGTSAITFETDLVNKLTIAIRKEISELI